MLHYFYALTHDPLQHESGRGGLRDHMTLQWNARTRNPRLLLQAEDSLATLNSGNVLTLSTLFMKYVPKTHSPDLF
jgi:hypothetical protein